MDSDETAAPVAATAIVPRRAEVVDFYGDPISAAELALAVKAVGQALAAQGDKSGYGRVYGERYRRYRISSYKRLPAAQYAACLAWLHGWYTEVQGAAQTGPAP